MAPHYAPSLRSRLAPSLLFLQIFFIVIYAFYVEIETHPSKRDLKINFYAKFQDIHVIVFLGFGFFSSFLIRYGFSGIGFNLLVAAMATQWALLLNGMESWYYRGKVSVDLRSLVVAEMCTASALISIGSVLGKTNPVQLTVIALLEVTGFVFNQWLLRSLLRVRLLNSIMQLHVFGPFFGLTLTWILNWKGSEQQFEKEKSASKPGLFSMLGSVFMWMFWPSFNSILVDERAPARELAAACSTYLALAAGAVAAAAVASLLSPKGKLSLRQVQSCVQAGGVAVGASLSSIRQPWEAMTIGLSAAVLSAVAFRHLKEHVLLAHQCHDTCGALSAYGVPGLLGWTAQLLLQIRDCEDPTTAVRFAVFHVCTIFVTLTLSLLMGLITGAIVKWNFWRPPQDKKCFDDQAFWEFPHVAVRK